MKVFLSEYTWTKAGEQYILGIYKSPRMTIKDILEDLKEQFDENYQNSSEFIDIFTNCCQLIEKNENDYEVVLSIINEFRNEGRYAVWDMEVIE